MKERPILFSAPMVRALLDGSKTQTRRVIKASQRYDHWPPSKDTVHTDYFVKSCPYGQPGDRLWVRERFRALDCGEIDYFADGKEVWERMQDHLRLSGAAKWKPSIHMPRWASRITLEVIDVRVERLQDISPADCIAEGVGGSSHSMGRCDLTTAYTDLWTDINGPGSWGANPWVWVVEFKRIAT